MSKQIKSYTPPPTLAPVVRKFGRVASIIDRSARPGARIRDIVRSPKIIHHGGILISDGGADRLVPLLDDQSLRRYLVAAEIAKIARAAGARHKVPPDVLRRAVDLVIDHFNLLGIDEIGAAFDLAAAGKIDGVNLAMYGGSFNVVYLSELLKAYKRHRAEIRREIDKQNDAADRAAKDEATRAELSGTAERLTVSSIVETFKEAAAGRKRLILAYQYDILDRAGFLSFSPHQKREAMRRAAELIKKELTGKKSEVAGFKRLEISRTLANLDENGAAVAARAKVLLLQEMIAAAVAEGLTLDAFKRRFV